MDIITCPMTTKYLISSNLELKHTIENLVKISSEYMLNLNNLEHKYESTTNGYTSNYLNLISVISILLTISVITSKNPIVSILFLIGVFFNIACYLILIGISFVGLSYLLVYVGAVSILFLFILMLINIKVSELVTDNTNSIPLVFITALFFSYPIQQILPTNIVNFINLSGDMLNKNYNFFSFYTKKFLYNYVSNDRYNPYITSKL